MSKKTQLEISEPYYRTQMQKELIIEKLKENGCRITRQRQILLDIILEHECSSCKEIYYKASQANAGIGTATVYRMVNLLEEIGAISRKNMYRVIEPEEMDAQADTCRVELDDNSVYQLSMKDWNQVVKEGLRVCGYVKSQNVVSVSVGKSQENPNEKIYQ